VTKGPGEDSVGARAALLPFNLELVVHRRSIEAARLRDNDIVKVTSPLDHDPRPPLHQGPLRLAVRAEPGRTDAAIICSSAVFQWRASHRRPRWTGIGIGSIGSQKGMGFQIGHETIDPRCPVRQSSKLVLELRDSSAHDEQNDRSCERRSGVEFRPVGPAKFHFPLPFLEAFAPLLGQLDLSTDK